MLQVLLSAEAFASYGWRIAFLVSFVLVFIGLLVRLTVAETPAFRAMDGAGRAFGCSAA